MSLDQAIAAVSELLEPRERVMAKPATRVVLWPHEPTPAERDAIAKLLSGKR